MWVLIVDDQKEQYINFIKNLKIDKPEINIKIVISAIEAQKQLKYHKFDLIILDQFMGGGKKDGTAFLENLRNQSRGQYPEIIFVTGNYDDLPTEEILNIDVPITLFLEKDLYFQETVLVATQLVLRRIEGKVRYDPKDLFGDQFLDMILNDSNEIIKSKHKGYCGLPQQRQIGTLIRSYVNSLKMRSKWDADDVLELSIFFAQSLCKVFNLPTDLINVLRKFLNLEEVLYTVPHYRDHFFHQIKVFFLGFCIINTLNRNGHLNNTILNDETGIKIWFITSVFHDIGYPFEKMAKWLDSYIESNLRSPGDPLHETEIIPIQFHWGCLLGKRFHAYHLERITKKICQLYNKNTPDVIAEILSEFTSFVVGKPDHGLYSSLIVQNFLRYKLMDDEVDPISVAIALHNNEVAKIINRIIGPQTFDKDPLSFLLAFCDLAQDWGRIRSTGISRSGYSKFGYPVYASNNVFDQDKKCIRIILRYNRKFTLVEREDWIQNIFQKFIEPSRNCWAVSASGHQSLTFCIEYQTVEKENLSLRTLIF